MASFLRLAPLVLACCVGRFAPTARVATFAAPAPASPTPSAPPDASPTTVPTEAPGAARPLFLGRFDLTDPEHPRFSWSGSTIVVRFTGPTIALTLEDNGWNWYEVAIDGKARPPLGLAKGVREYRLATDLDDGEHVLRFTRRNEAHGGVTRLVRFGFAEGHRMLAPPPRPPRRIEFVGDSITCGFGTEGRHPCPFEYRTENHEHGYAALTARALDAEAHTVCWSGWGIVRGADGGWGANVPSVYDRTLHKHAQPAWDASTFHPHAIVIALGTNDFGVGDPGDAFVYAYTSFLAHLRELHPDAWLIATTSPMLRDAQKARQLDLVARALDRRRASSDERLAIVDFPVQSYAAMGCGTHPGTATHAAMAEQLEGVLREKLGW